MNRLLLLIYSMLLCGFVSCSASGKSTEPVKVLEKTDSCKSDPKNTYEVFIPVHNRDVKLPLLIIIDPHGNGKFALKKFKLSASQYPAILIASNLIKNGFEEYERAISALSDDVKQKYPVNESVFITGFSGGARMALGYALAHPLNGLILCSALANAEQINAIRCPVISISGMDDFNFIETAQYLFQEQSIPANLRIELTNSSHNWPESKMLANAWGYLSFQVESGKTNTWNESQLKLFCKQQQMRIDSLKLQGEYLRAALVAQNMASSENSDNNKFFTSAYNGLKSCSEYNDQLNRLEKCLNLEITVRQQYLDAFRTKDELWWKNEIKSTEEKITTEHDGYTRDMYMRIKGFLGIASYTFCKQAVKEHNAEVLNKTLTIYSMLEPENPDMFYFSSFPYFWKGNNDATLSKLKKALKLGFSDRNQLFIDFPASITSKL